MVLFYGAPGGIRTPDLKVRSLAFYPAKLRAHKYVIYYNAIFEIFQVFFKIFYHGDGVNGNLTLLLKVII